MQVTEQDMIVEQIALDPWLSKQEWSLTPAPDGQLILRVYVDDFNEIPFGRVRNVGCQIIYESNEPLYAPGARLTPSQKSEFACEQRGMKER